MIYKYSPLLFKQLKREAFEFLRVDGINGYTIHTFKKTFSIEIIKGGYISYKIVNKVFISSKFYRGNSRHMPLYGIAKHLTNSYK